MRKDKTDYERFGEAVNDFKKVFFKEMVEPWAKPFVEWLDKKLSRYNKTEYHNHICDVDPKTMTWRKDIKKGEHALVCRNCYEKTKH